MRFFTRFALPLVFFAVVIAGLQRRFPPPDTDETFIAAHGWNLISGQGQRYSLYDDVFAPSVYPWRDAFGQVIESAYNGWVGVWLKIGGRTLMSARAASLGAALMAALVFMMLGMRLGGPRMAFWMGTLLVLDPVFWTGSLVVRPETLLLLSESGLAWFILVRPLAKERLAFVIGAWVALQMAIHPNALALAPGFLIWWALSEPELTYSNGVACGAGLVTGALLFFCTLNIPVVRLVPQSIAGQLQSPPFLHLSEAPTRFLGLLWHKLFLRQTYYFSTDSVAGWWMALTLRRLLLAFCLVGSAVTLRQPNLETALVCRRRACWAGLGVTWLCHSLLVSKDEVLYILNFYPFILPLSVEFLVAPGGFFVRWGRMVRSASAAGLLASFGCFAFFLVRSLPLVVPYAEIQRQFLTLVPGRDDRILAPNLFWFSVEPSRFRDLGALTYSRWYTGGQTNLAECLGHWKPTILVTDPSFERSFIKGASPRVRLEQTLPVHARSLGTIQSGSGSYGAFTVFRLDWDQ